MILFWPWFLLMLLSIPLLAACYWWVQRRRKRKSLRYSSVAIVRLALPKQSRLRRYLPLVMFLMALASLVISLARPAVVLTHRASHTTVILVMDVSSSMAEDDIQPSRLVAAESAALSFVRSKNSISEIGIVAFSGSARLVQPPTTDQDQLEAAIRSLTIGDSTAIGSGILEGLRVIAQMHKRDLPPLGPAGQDAEQPYLAQSNWRMFLPIYPSRHLSEPKPSKSAWLLSHSVGYSCVQP